MSTGKLRGLNPLAEAQRGEEQEQAACLEAALTDDSSSRLIELGIQGCATLIVVIAAPSVCLEHLSLGRPQCCLRRVGVHCCFESPASVRT